MTTSLLHNQSTSRAYPDLHEHLAALDAAGLLIRVAEPVNKDTELHALVRWQFRGGIREADRRAFLFENVVDSRGRAYELPVVVGALAANREIYRMAMGCPLDEINERWRLAMASPIDPVLVPDGACQEVVSEGASLAQAGGGLDALPIPISTPGWDNAPYTSVSHFITRDPDTGVQNVGNYRGQVKAPLRLGMNPSIELRPGIYQHWLKYRARGEKLPCAVVLGGPPCVTLAAVQKVPESIDELAVAGGLVGSPIKVVRARTVDLLVPAEAEIVIEGFIDTSALEPEGPVGESHGYVNLQEYNAFLDVTAITRRRDAVLPSIISQVTPSESSLIKRVAYEASFTDHLQNGLGIRGVRRVALHEPLTNLRKVVVVQVARETPQTEVWRALYAMVSVQRAVGKLVIAVNEDIDPESSDALLWALSYRMKPHIDMQIVPHKDPGHGPRDEHGGPEDSAVLFNATLRHDFPPISLPKREYMERARVLWERLGLPPLRPEAPWFGISLGNWPKELEAEAELAVQGRYFENGASAEARRRTDVAMNTPIRDVDSLDAASDEGEPRT